MSEFPHPFEPAAREDKARESPFKSTGGPARLVNALRYSMRGLGHAFRKESAFRQELALAVVLVPLALWLSVTPVERVALIGSVLLVLIVELINSSVEAVVDRISLERHELSGRAKDLGSAAVFVALVLCALTWLVIAGPALRALF